MKKKADGSDLVTKDYLDFRFEEFEDKIVDRIQNAITESTSKLYTRIDPLLFELEDRRLDIEITTQKLEELDVRVTKLEHS